MKGKLVEISTGITIQPAKWIATGNGCIKGSSDQVKLQNARLADIRVRINEIYFDLLRRKQPITPQIIKDIFSGKFQVSYTLLEIAQNLIEYLKEDPDISPGTVRTYRTRIKNLTEWLVSINRKDMLCEEIEVQTAKDFMLWIRRRGSGLDHTRKNALALKKVMNHAVAMKIVPGNPLNALRMKKAPPKPIVFLSEEEFVLLAQHTFRAKRLQQVADMFVLQCCTGIAYAELARLSQKDISPGPDGRNWLRIERTKIPGAVCRIPLMAKAENVLTKYVSGSPSDKIPVISNGNYNAYLKEVAAPRWLKWLALKKI